MTRQRFTVAEKPGPNTVSHLVIDNGRQIPTVFVEVHGSGSRQQAEFVANALSVDADCGTLPDTFDPSDDPWNGEPF